MFKPMIPGVLLSLVLFVAISCIGLLSPILSELMVDGYLKNKSATESDLIPYLLVVLAMFGCTFFSRLLSTLRSIITARIGTKAAFRLRSVVFEKIQQLSLAGVNRRTTGELMQRVTDDTAVLKNFLATELGSIVEIVTTFLAIGVILIVSDIQNHTPLFLLIFVPAIPAIALFQLFHKRIRRIYRTQWMVNSKASTLLHDIFSGIRVVKAFGREKAEIVKYEGAIGAVKKVQKRNELFWAVFSPMLNTLMTMGEFFVLFYVGNAILNGGMTLGEMTKFTAYASMIYGPLRSMAFIPRRILRATTSLSKIYDLMVDDDVMKKEEAAVNEPLKGQVTLRDVTFGYEAGKPVLKHVSLDVHPGEMIGIVGRSGVGKSTLINLVMRLYDVEEGQVLLDGKDVRKTSPESLRNGIGAVLQETFLFAGTIKDNIAYAKPGATEEEIISAAKVAGAHEFIMRQKDGYDSYVGEKGCTLSGGERQRIAIARAVLLDPRILILDEATSALDTETEKQIQEALKKLIAGRTTLAIAHRLSTLRNATRLIVLDDHGIAESGTHEELMQNKNGIYYGLVMAQRQMSSKKQ
jgi:ATP-binding cassette subfamily B protein